MKVQKVRAITKIELEQKKDIKVGETKEIIASKDSNETEKIIWESSDNNIVKIISENEDRVTIKAINEGEATITARNYIGTISSSCKIYSYPEGTIDEIDVFSYAKECNASDSDFGFSTYWSPNSCDRKTFDYTNGFRIGQWSGTSDFIGSLTLDFSKYLNKILSVGDIDIRFALGGQAVEIRGKVEVNYYDDDTVDSFTTKTITDTEVGAFENEEIKEKIKNLPIKNIKCTIWRTRSFKLCRC